MFKYLLVIYEPYIRRKGHILSHNYFTKSIYVNVIKTNLSNLNICKNWSVLRNA